MQRLDFLSQYCCGAKNSMKYKYYVDAYYAEHHKIYHYIWRTGLKNIKQKVECIDLTVSDSSWQLACLNGEDLSKCPDLKRISKKEVNKLLKQQV